MNRNIFRTTSVPSHDLTTHQGARGFSQSPRHELAQFAVSGIFDDGFYEDAGEKLSRVTRLCAAVTPEFVAACAIYGADRGWMKDAPCFLLAWLMTNGHKDLAARVAPRAIRSSRTLRTFVDIVRSGKLGKKSFSKSIERYIKSFLVRATPSQFIAATVGKPTMRDLLRIFHARPNGSSQDNAFKWALGKPFVTDDLPREVRAFIDFTKADDPTALAVPDVPFMMLTNTKMSAAQWYEKAKQMPWQALRGSLVTLDKRDVFTIDGAAATLAARLRDPQEIDRANVFPVQLFNAWKMVREKDLPIEIQGALQDAMDVVMRTTAQFVGADRVSILLDVSGSMGESHKPAGQDRPNIDFAAPIAVAAAMSSKATELFFGLFTDRLVEVPPPGRALPAIQVVIGALGGGTNTTGAVNYALNERGNGLVDLLLLFTDEQEGQYGASPRAVYDVIREHLKKRQTAKAIIFQFGAYGPSGVPENDRAFIQNRVLKLPGNNMNALRTAIEWHKAGGDFVSLVESYAVPQSATVDTDEEA